MFCQIRKHLNASVVSNRLQIVLSPNGFAFRTSLNTAGTQRGQEDREGRQEKTDCLTVSSCEGQHSQDLRCFI